MKKVVSAFLACLSLSLSGYLPLAQAEEWRKKPPQAQAPRPFKLPNIIKYQLSNGLAVELVEDHRVPFTTAGLGINAGAVDDARQYQGIAALVADLLSQGAAGKSSKAIAEEIDFIGGALSGGAGSDFTIVSASALSQYNAKLMDLFGKVVLTPDFPQSELNLRKTNLIQELKIRRSKPDFLREEKFAGVVFGAHPYSFVAPKPDVIEKITREQLQAFHKEHYLPGGSVLVVVGDFKTDEMKALIAKTFGDWKQGNAPKNEFTAATKQSGRKIYLVDRPGSVQSSVRIGNIGIKRSDPDFYAMNVANQVLGGAAVSRLFTNIRENKGYTYGAYSEMSARKEPGALSAAAEVRTDVTAAAVQEFLYELERIRNVKPTDKELTAAKNYLAGSFQLGLETQNGLAQRLLEGKLYGLPDNYLETYGEKIMAVNADDVRRVARGHIDQDNLVVVVVGDAGKIKADLEYFAPVSVFDTAGSLVKSEEKAKKTGS
ncbi:MAG: insulinase family protein [Candidatus Obscuribacterales bacterium]|nr:insulinase family protein [Candidatus Obscuribacterales bacterium]